MADNSNDINKERASIEVSSLTAANQMLGIQKKILEAMESRNIAENIFLKLQEKGLPLSEDELKAIVNTHHEHKKYVGSLQKQLQYQKEGVGFMEKAAYFAKGLNNTLQPLTEYLFKSDAAIKSIALQFGIAGGRAEQIRTAIEKSAVHSARLGVSVEDLSNIHKGYVDQVGRTVSLGDDQLTAMAALSKGTGLAIEGAAELAGNMEMMGMDAIAVNQSVEGILETSERMGVNATKVLKGVSANFKKLQTYTFKSGVQGMAQMAIYSEKFKIDMDDALGAAEKSRRLEGAVELAAQLQVLGGEFAKSDPFEMLFLSRNDPAQFQKKIGDLTKGMATLNKVGDKFEFQLASPMSRDLLEQAGKALGISTEKMTEMALQQAKFAKTQDQMLKSGYTKEQMEIIDGLAQMDSSTGKFFVNVKGVRRDIANLSKGELETLKEQKISLEERAKNAQTFEEQWGIFMQELKASALPLLNGINEVLTNYVRPALDSLTTWLGSFGDTTKTVMKWVGGLLAGVLVAIPAMIKVQSGWKATTEFFKSMGGAKGMKDIAGQGAGSTLSGSQALGQGKGALAAGKGAGLSALGKGAGVGVAAAGMGAGVMMAAKGIASIAEAMKGLNKEQIDGLTIIAVTIMPAMAIGMKIMASAAEGSVKGIAILTLGIMGMGFGMKMAGEGMNLIFKGLTELIPVAAASKDSLVDVALGIGAIQLALMAGGAGSIFSVMGAGAFALGLAAIGSQAGSVLKVGNALEQIKVALSGSKEDYAQVRETIDAISKADFSNLKALNSLSGIFSKPLVVEFSNKDLQLVSNITLEIDGDKFVQKLNLAEKLSIQHKRAIQGVRS